jgi:ribosome-associated protein
MNSPDSLALVTLCCRALADKKAEDLRVLAVGEKSSVTDYVIIATANSEPHLRALRIELERAVDGSGTKIIGTESPQGSGWTVMDLFDVMVHLFLPDMRRRYRLEHLWREVPEVSVPRLLGEPEPVVPPAPAPEPVKAAVKKPAPKKKTAAKKPTAKAAAKKKPAKVAVKKKPSAKKKPAAKKKSPAKKKPAARKKRATR